MNDFNLYHAVTRTVAWSIGWTTKRQRERAAIRDAVDRIMAAFPGSEVIDEVAS